MKTAVSIPDDLFQSAECAAADMGVSRSRLYSLAVAEYLKHLQDQRIAQQLDQYFAANPDDAGDPEIDLLAVELLAKEAW